MQDGELRRDGGPEPARAVLAADKGDGRVEGDGGGLHDRHSGKAA